MLATGMAGMASIEREKEGKKLLSLQGIRNDVLAVQRLQKGAVKVICVYPVEKGNHIFQTC